MAGVDGWFYELFGVELVAGTTHSAVLLSLLILFYMGFLFCIYRMILCAGVWKYNKKGLFPSLFLLPLAVILGDLTLSLLVNR